GRGSGALVVALAAEGRHRRRPVYPLGAHWRRPTVLPSGSGRNVAAPQEPVAENSPDSGCRPSGESAPLRRAVRRTRLAGGMPGSAANALLGARWQMALSLGFHIVFAALGVGLPLLLVAA